MRPAKHARQARIRPPKACPVLAGATIVPRANIPQKKATRNRRNVKPVSSDFFKIYRATPRAANAQLDLATKLKVRQRAMQSLQVRTIGMDNETNNFQAKAEAAAGSTPEASSTLRSCC